MKRTSIFLTIALIILSIASGCGRKPAEPDARLAAADALMQERPDSAKLILDTIDAKAFTDDEANNAFFALLRVQSDYRNYIVATQKSDSLIDIALDYYTREHNAHPNDKTLHEHYTRSLNYKAAVCYELGLSENAMEYYKKAEITSDPDDHFNRGYSQYKIASLYHQYYNNPHSSISHYKDAYNELKQTDDLHFSASCLQSMGALYRAFNPDSAEYYLHEALKISEAIGDSAAIYMTNDYLAEHYYNIKKYREAVDLALRIIEVRPDMIQSFYTATMAYVGLNKPDSAMIMLDKYPPLKDASDSILYYYALSNVCLEKGQKDNCRKYYLLQDSLSNTLLFNTTNINLHNLEQKTVQQSIQLEKLSLENKNNKLKFIIALVMTISLLVVLLLAYIGFKAKKKLLVAIAKLENDKHDLEVAKDELGEKMERIKEFNRHLKDKDRQVALYKLLNETLDKRLKLTSDVMKNIQYRGKRKGVDNILATFLEEIKMNDLNESFWDELEIYFNNCYPALASEIANNKAINKQDKKLIQLTSLNLPNTAIMLCLDKPNLRSLRNAKYNIMANKLQKGGTLSEYLQKMKTIRS